MSYQDYKSNMAWGFLTPYQRSPFGIDSYPSSICRLSMVLIKLLTWSTPLSFSWYPSNRNPQSEICRLRVFSWICIEITVFFFKKFQAHSLKESNTVLKTRPFIYGLFIPLIKNLFVVYWDHHTLDMGSEAYSWASLILISDVFWSLKQSDEASGLKQYERLIHTYNCCDFLWYHNVDFFHLFQISPSDIRGRQMTAFSMVFLIATFVMVLWLLYALWAA